VIAVREHEPALRGIADPVNVIDDLSSGRLDNIEHLRSNPRFSFTMVSVAGTEIPFDQPAPSHGFLGPSAHLRHCSSL